MKEKRCFVQFIHPGGEHRPDVGDLKQWNTGPHKRKFLRCRGRIEGRRRTRPLAFWGEWEPPSRVVQAFEYPLPEGPRYLWEPYYYIPRSKRGLQNTDPFVFDGFYYTICRQVRKDDAATQLRHLARGSVLLFGSHKAGRFVLDTVFVVRDFVDHDARNFRKVLDGVVPADYPEIVLAPWYDGRVDEGCAPPRTSVRLYLGATDDEPYEGMFSFFPCREDDGAAGFPRPDIHLDGLISSTARQVGRITQIDEPTRLRQLWRSVYAQVREAGCRIGVWAEMPPRED